MKGTSSCNHACWSRIIVIRTEYQWCPTYSSSSLCINPKEAGSFDPISQPGGGGADSAPPRISAAERRKILKFEPTFDYIMLCNLRTVRPIFPKIAPKVAQDFKEKSHILAWKKMSAKLSRETLRGADSAPPPLPGPFRVKGEFHPKTIIASVRSVQKELSISTTRSPLW